MTLQKEPNSLEIAANAQRDAEGRLGYEFSPGFLVYWRVVKEEVRFLQPNIGPSERIEVLALVSAGIKISEPAAGVGGAPLNMEQEIAERVYSRKTSVGSLSMWGTLHVSRNTRKTKGWIVDSWSHGSPFLHPKMHWVSIPDYKLHHMQLNIDFNSTMQIGPEDTSIEEQRLVFIRATLRQWELDWLTEQTLRWQGS